MVPPLHQLLQMLSVKCAIKMVIVPFDAKISPFRVPRQYRATLLLTPNNFIQIGNLMSKPLIVLPEIWKMYM